ncbi:hypothetical protein C0992_007675 [Termitomyces sp. T32_za158]|nr:hypothetical protein C0992_007675 [Termitomyces sp. T32_za158]
MGTGNLLRKNTKASLEIVQKAVSKYLEEQNKFIEDLAQRHLVDKERVRKMIAHRAPGDRVKLKEILNRVDNNPELDASKMNNKRKKELTDELVEYPITIEMKNLFLRTGVRSFAFFSRSHAEDSVTTFTATSDNTVMKFFPGVLKLDYAEVLAKFEIYSCLENRSAVKPDTLSSMRAECTGLILDGLRSILVNKTVKMNYLNYDTAIIEKYHVNLAGWPSRIPFGSPSNISTVDDIRLLRSALRDGDCKWRFLTAEEQREHDRKLAEARGQGVTIGKKRKERSDKGKPRNQEKAQQSKKKKTSQLPPGAMYKSAEFVDDAELQAEVDDDESNGSGGDD